MKAAMIALVLALAVAPLGNFTAVHTWSGDYAKWTMPEDRFGAWYLATHADPQPADRAWCIANPWMPQCKLPPLRGN
jgi:hypothetical protein